MSEKVPPLRLTLTWLILLTPLSKFICRGTTEKAWTVYCKLVLLLNLSHMLRYIILMGLVFFTSCTQQPQITAVNLEKGADFQGEASDVLRFPVVKTGDAHIDSLINHDFKNKMTDSEFKAKKVTAALQEWTESGITFMDYKVTFNDKNLISFQVTAAFAGAYLTNWDTYFNYSTLTGKSLSLDEVIDMTGAFKTTLVADKLQFFAAAKKELQKSKDGIHSDFDLNTERWALEYDQSSEENMTFKHFMLFDNHITIVQD
jgi:hypothetical protein